MTSDYRGILGYRGVRLERFQCIVSFNTLHHDNTLHTSIGGGKGGARGLKPPLGLLRGGLAPPQNDITPKLSFLEWG